MDKRAVHWQEIFNYTPQNCSEEFDVNVYFRHGWARRIEVFTQLLKSYLEKGEIGHSTPAVDLGCGTGKYSRIMNSLGFNVTALDLSREMLKYAADKEKTHILYVNGNCGSLPFKDNTFNLAVSFGVISIITGPFPFYSELKRISSSQNSMLMLMTLNKLYPPFFFEDLFNFTKKADCQTTIIAYHPFRLKHQLKEVFTERKIEVVPIYVFPWFLRVFEPILQKSSFLHKLTIFMAKAFFVIIRTAK